MGYAKHIVIPFLPNNSICHSPNDRYTTFCTPEAAKAIDDYLELRKRYGDNLDGNSYLFIKNFNKMQSSSCVASTNLIDKRPITAGAIHAYVVDRLVESGLRTVHSFSAVSTNNNRFFHASSYKNELHPCHFLRIFAVTNMQRSKVDKIIMEMLVGHSTGLDKSYYKPQDEEILHEYLKAVDSLTIDNENRLKQQIQKVTDERDEIKSMEEKHKEEMKKIREEMSLQFNQIMSCKNHNPNLANVKPEVLMNKKI